MEVANNTLFNTSYPDDTNATIPSITTPTTELGFPMNTWGYSEDNGTSYLTVASKNKMVDINHAINESITNLKFATKININKPSGNYSGTIRFVAVTNYVPMTLSRSYAASGKSKVAIAGNKYYAMQDMDADICSNADLDETGLQVVDIRDNKLYWIAKLKDGNCWMTQNLDLDLNENTLPLTTSTSDRSLGTSGSNYMATDVSTLCRSIGMYVYSCNSGWSWDGGDYYWKGTSYPSFGSATNYSSISAYSSDISAAGVAGSHYHVGNIYPYKTGASGYSYDPWFSGDAPNSICPKGWRLPTSSGDAPSFYGLITAYDITDGSSGYKKLTAAPLFFVPVASFHWIEGNTKFLSDSVYLTSRRDGLDSGCGNTLSYCWKFKDFRFNSSRITYNSSLIDYNAFSVRCVAR